MGAFPSRIGTAGSTSGPSRGPWGRGRWEEAVSCYRKGLEADELAEELYRRLMVCHIRQGREAEALSVYRGCRKTLSSVLGVNPSAETRKLAESIGLPLVCSLFRPTPH